LQLLITHTYVSERLKPGKEYQVRLCAVKNERFSDEAILDELKTGENQRTILGKNYFISVNTEFMFR